MGNRIATIQRGRAEQGRLRFGILAPSSNGGQRPKALLTWILSSHREEHIRDAAHIWGGTVERWKPQGNGAEQWRVITEANSIDAILPTGDPLNQSYEMWSRGGCQRRCDGLTEEFSGSPCLCLAQFGEDFHEQATGTVCGEKTRLGVFLPDMQGIGSWRMETGSYWATREISGAMQDIRDAVGDQILVPITLHLEQRTKVRDGKTSQYILPVMNIRGATFGQMLAGALSRAPAVSAGQAPAAVEGARPAISAAAEPAEPAPLRDFVSEIKEAPTRDDVVALWNEAKQAKVANAAAVEAAAGARVKELEQAKAAGPAQGNTATMRANLINGVHACQTLDQITTALTQAQMAGFAKDLDDTSDELVQAFVARRRELQAAKVYDPNPGGTQDPERLWAEIVTAASLEGFERTDDIEHAFATRWNGDQPGAASAMQLQTFLDELRDGKVRPPQVAAVAASTSADDDSEVPF